MGGSGSGSSDFGTRRGGGAGGGGAAGGAGGRKKQPAFDCDGYVAKTTLRSPKKVVIDSLTKQDILDLKLTSKKPPINAVTQDGEVAGSVVLVEQDDLVKCINTGTEYVAEVLAIEGGTCIVKVYAWKDD